MDPADQLGIVRDIMEQHLKHDEQQRQQQQEQQTIAALQSTHIPLETVTVDALHAHQHHEAMQVDSMDTQHHHQHEHHDDSHTVIVEAARAASVMDQDMTATSSPSSSIVPNAATPDGTPGASLVPAFTSTYYANRSSPPSVGVSEAAVAVAASMSSAHAFAEATAMLESVQREQGVAESEPSSSTSALSHISTEAQGDEYDVCPKILRLPLDQWETWLEEQQKRCRWNMTRYRARDKPTYARGPTASEWTREFQCIHAGSYRDRKNPNINPKKKRNRGKSIKVGCTAFIKMRKMFDEEAVHVEFGWQHKNHTLDAIDDIRNQRLPFDLKAWIKQRVVEGSSWKSVKGILIENESPLLDELQPSTREHVHLIITQCYGHFANVSRQLKKKSAESPAELPAERNNRGTIIQFELDENVPHQPIVSDAASAAATAAATATWNLTSELTGQTLAIQSLVRFQDEAVAGDITEGGGGGGGGGGPTESGDEAAAAAAAAAAVAAMDIAGDPSEEIQRRLQELQEATAQGTLHIDVTEPTSRVLSEAAGVHSDHVADVHAEQTVSIPTTEATSMHTEHARTMLTEPATRTQPVVSLHAKPTTRLHPEPAANIHAEPTTRALSEPPSRVLSHNEALAALTAAATAPTPGQMSPSSPEVLSRPTSSTSMDIDDLHHTDDLLIAGQEKADLTAVNTPATTASSLVEAGTNTTTFSANPSTLSRASISSRTPHSHPSMSTKSPNVGLPHARDQMRDILREIRQLESQMENTVQYTNEDDAVRIIESFRLPIRLMKEAVERGASAQQ